MFFLYVLLALTTVKPLLSSELCSKVEEHIFSSDGAQELMDVLVFKETDVVIVIDDNAFLAEALYDKVRVKELIAIIKDEESCDAFEQRARNSEQKVRVVCGGLSQADLFTATVIIAPSVSIKPRALLQKVVQLPDGVKVFTRHQLDHHESLYLEAIRSVAISALASVLMYEYVVKRPTVADLLTEMFRDMTGYGISTEEGNFITQAGGDPTYGEIEFSSAEKIFSELVPVTESDVFYDLGCGIGKLVLWAYLATPAKKVVAIELSKTRYDAAMKAKKLMQETVLPKRKAIMRADWGDKADAKTLGIIEGDIADADISDATIIYMCSTCYPEPLMKTMTEKFARLKDGLRIVTLKELPQHPSIHPVGTPQRFPMSWSSEKGSPVYIYEKRDPSLKDVLDKAYEGIDGFNVSDEEKDTIKKEGGAPTYGEITYDSAKIVFKDILKIKSDDVFYDLGSGTGKLAVQAHLETPAATVVGIELSPTRFAASEKAKSRVDELLAREPYATLWKEKWGGREKTIEFRHGNIMETPLASATKIFACSTCFSSELMASISEFCMKLPEGARVATLKKLTQCSRLTLVKTHKLPTTWSSSAEVFEYVVGAPKGAAKEKSQKVLKKAGAKKA